jgi:hypothetical protein
MTMNCGIARLRTIETAFSTHRDHRVRDLLIELRAQRSDEVRRAPQQSEPL